jgi:hypothetical protein
MVIDLLEPFLNFLLHGSELLGGTLECHVWEDSVLTLIFKPLIEIIHMIYRWIRMEISQLTHVQCFSKYSTV